MQVALKSLVLAAASSMLFNGAAFAQESDAAAIAMLTGPDRQATLEAGAREEGQVNLYTTLNIDPAVNEIKAAFEEKYPFITLNYVRDNGNNLVQKILAESQAGRPLADVAVGSTLEGLVPADFLLPFVSPEMDAFPPEMRGEDNKWFTYRLSYYGVAYNTNLIAPEDAPQTIDDLLDPKWQGRMIWSTNFESGGALFIKGVLAARGEEAAGEYFARLAEQNVAKQDASARALLDLVIAGEYEIMLPAGLHHVALSQQNGANLGIINEDRVPARMDSVQLIPDTPNPHAAMLFIDFLLSEEGQSLLNRIGYQPARTGIQPTPEFQHIIPEANGRTAELFPPFGTDEDGWVHETFEMVSP